MVTISSFAFGESSVWKVSSGNSHLYLGGTVHLLKTSDHPLPKEFEAAYHDAQVIYFETDMAAINAPLFQARVMQAMMLKNGKTLRQLLAADTYKQLDAFFTKRGMNVAQFSTVSPAGISLMLATLELQRMGMSPQSGVDNTYYQRAVSDNKQQASLETPEQQLTFITQLGRGNENQMVLYTLRDLNQLPSVIGTMKQAWRSGDIKLLEKTSLTPLAKEFPSVYKALIVDRNKQWLPEIVAQLKTPNVELFLVGVLHLAGQDGLLQQLQNQGYTVTPVTSQRTEKQRTTAINGV